MHELSINEVTTYRWSFDEDVMNYWAAGIRAIGIWRDKLSDFGEEKALELLTEYPLAVSNLLWAGGFTGCDGRSFRESVADGRDAIRLAAQLHAGCLVIYSGSRSGHTLSHARRLTREALKFLTPIAEEFGVDLALEPMHPRCASDWTFLTGLDETLDLINELGSPRLKLVFDTYHLGHDQANLARVAQIAPRIAIVHLGDARGLPGRDQNRCPLLDGVIPLREIVESLMAAGYQGYFDVELIGEDSEPIEYYELLQHSKQAFSQLCDLNVA